MVDRSKWTLEIFAEFYEERLKNLQETNDERHKQNQTALNVALAANDKRLEAMNEFRNAINDQATRLIPRSEFEIAISGVHSKLEQNIAPLEEKINATGKTNWPLLTGFVSVVFGVLGGCWVLIGLQINVAETPLSTAVTQVKAAQTSYESTTTQQNERLRSAEQEIIKNALAASETRIELQRLTERMRSLEDSTSAGRADRMQNEARNRTALVEINTQFRSITNMIAVGNERMNQWMALIWPKVFPGTTFPRGLYTASIAHDDMGKHEH